MRDDVLPVRNTCWRLIFVVLSNRPHNCAVVWQRFAVYGMRVLVGAGFSQFLDVIAEEVPVAQLRVRSDTATNRAVRVPPMRGHARWLRSRQASALRPGHR